MVDFDGDGRSGYNFTVNLTDGVQDATITNESRFSKDWDGNWQHAVSEDGDTYVIQAGPEFKVLGKHSLGEMTLASPAVAHGSVLVRTLSNLYRITKTTR